MILVASKINPDLDGLACAYAYAKLLKTQGKQAVGGIFGAPHVEAEYLINRLKIRDISFSPKGPFDYFILVDASDLKGMPGVIKPEKVIEVVDHRPAPNVGKLFPAAAALIAEISKIENKDGQKFSYSFIWSDLLKYS